MLRSATTTTSTNLLGLSFSDDMNPLKDIIKCANYAAIKHRNQRRFDEENTPYINHPIGVAYILTEEAQVTDPIVIQAALLHDTVEDTDTTFDDIENSFGVEVRNIVEALTDDKSLSKAVRKELQIKNAKNCSYEAKLVKLADKLYNLRDLDKSRPVGWTEIRVKEYFEWAKKVVDNLQGTHPEMEAQLYMLFNKRNIV